MHELPALLAQVTAIFAFALLGVQLASGARAALRHLLLAVAFGAALVLPVAALLSPEITIEIAALPARAALPPADASPRLPIAQPAAAQGAPAETQAASTVPVPAPPALPSSTATRSSPVVEALLLAWAVVALLALVPVASALWQLRAIRRRSQPWPEGGARLEWLLPTLAHAPPVLLNPTLAAPISGGLLHPAIALPADAVTWSNAHLANALLHEMEHLRRRDWAMHLAARAVCALYWFHPLAWLAWRALRLEAERACDDAVVARADPAAYAEQLLQLARHLAGKPALPGLPMIGNSSLSSRIKSVLDTRQSRGRASTTAMVCIVIAAVVVVAALALLRPTGPAPAVVATSEVPAEATAAPVAAEPAPVGTDTQALATDAPIRFSGIRYTDGKDPHAYGQQIELCGHDGRWQGYFAEYAGSPADPPSARLERLRLDEGAGTVSFAAQVTAGAARVGAGVPATRQYEFSGRLDGKAMAGTLVMNATGTGAPRPVSEDIILRRETSSVAAMSCEEWSAAWSRRIAAGNVGAKPQAPTVRKSLARTPQEVVGDVLDLVQSALADESAPSLDELTYPITGLRHLKLYAQAVVGDDGSRPAELANNYIEIINALTITANMAANTARRAREPGASPTGFAQLSAALHARAEELAALLIPVSAASPAEGSTPARRAASSTLEVVQATYRDPRFVGPPGGSWLRTELDTLSRAAQSLLGEDGPAPGAATMKLHLLRSSIRSTVRQADGIANRAERPADTRRKATELATSLRDIEARFDMETRAAPPAPRRNVEHSDWQVTLRGVGPLPIGTTVQEARQLIGDPSAFLVQSLRQDRPMPHAADDAACAYLFTAQLPEQIGLMFQKGRLARVDVWRPGIRTSSGIQVGDMEAQVRNLHGSAVKATPRRSSPAGAHDMTLTPAARADRDYRMLFETDGAVVTGFRAGLRTAVERMEGCE